MNIKSFLKKLIPTWKTDEQLKLENEETLALLAEVNEVNQGLNYQAGEMWRAIQELKQEAATLLKAVTMQYGGELTIKPEFFSVLSEPGNINLQLAIEKNNDTGAVKLTLVPTEEEEE